MQAIILAAGMGSRYGGLKQLDPITDQGEFIIDFSVFDAIRAGFNKVVFVIKEENLELFRQTIGSRFESRIHVEYAFQDLTDLPEGFSVPEGRIKPWGTAQALLAARNIVKEPFAVINADDFYGKSAYELLAKHLSAPKTTEPSEYCMVGYVLENTLTENGTVSRGVCNVDKEGYLLDVTERTAIRRVGDEAAYEEKGEDYPLPLSTVVSMNCWGFTPDVFDRIGVCFRSFLSDLGENPLKCEFYLPFAVREIMEKGECRVRVYESDSAWYGVTYHEDKEKVHQSLEALKASGVYPKELSRN